MLIVFAVNYLIPLKTLLFAFVKNMVGLIAFARLRVPGSHGENLLFPFSTVLI